MVFFRVVDLHRFYCIVKLATYKSLIFEVVSLVEEAGLNLNGSNPTRKVFWHQCPFWEHSGSLVECLETEGSRVRASPASLRCVLEQDTFILA